MHHGTCHIIGYLPGISYPTPSGYLSPWNILPHGTHLVVATEEGGMHLTRMLSPLENVPDTFANYSAISFENLSGVRAERQRRL